MLSHVIDTKIGQLYLEEEDGCITRLTFMSHPEGRYAEKRPSSEKVKAAGKGQALSPILAEAERQLKAYFEGKLKKFDLPLCPKGTEFQQKVWAELQRIPHGQTASYKDVAERLGNPKSCRAVGMANNKNPIAIVIPCHRVVGANGKMVGYAGGLDVKQTLLRLEGGLL